MSRNYVLQMACNDELRKSIENYQKEKELGTMAEAGRELIEFALRILNNANEDEGVSNRELLEEVLRVLNYNTATTNVVHGQSFNMGHLNENKHAASELRSKLKADSEIKTEVFLAGKGG